MAQPGSTVMFRCSGCRNYRATTHAAWDTGKPFRCGAPDCDRIVWPVLNDEGERAWQTLPPGRRPTYPHPARASA